MGVEKMIDKVKMYKRIDLDTSKFSRKFHYNEFRRPSFTGARPVYTLNINLFTIKYFPNSSILAISGRLVNLSPLRNKVDTLGNYYKGKAEDYIEENIKELSRSTIEEGSTYIIDDEGNDKLLFPNKEQYDYYDVHMEYDLDELIEESNKIISSSIGTTVDIRNFNLTYIEASFNVSTPYVSQYIELFNRIFKVRKLKRYKNYVLETEKPLYSSFYIKSKSAYENNLKIGYTVNFYNKHDQLLYMRNLKKKYKTKITNKDLTDAENILRFEVQLHYKGIRDVIDKYGVEKKFGDFLDVDLLRNIVVDKYNHLLCSDELDFYSYKELKNTIEISDLSPTSKKGLLGYCLKLAANNNVEGIKGYRNKQLREHFQAAPFFIPKEFNMDHLESPIRLLDREIEVMNQAQLDFEEERIGNHKTRVESYEERKLRIFAEDLEMELFKSRIKFKSQLIYKQMNKVQRYHR